ERFIQVNSGDEITSHGSGLGLFITKAYVEMLGGKIGVESEEGVGSTFFFSLPCKPEPANKAIGQQQPAPLDTNDHIQKLKLLVVEDDEVSRKLIDSVVKLFGKEILHAKTGVEAVDACRKNADIDLVLMDIRMPEMDGYEATREIRKFNERVAIIAQTAYGLSGDREKAMEAGCNDYIAKPLKKEYLVELMRKIFKHSY
ncbi:MAG: response regulator, partial [Bacteroidales bacterium]|nr:response regulator [Bacteroidales bacterium]